MNVEQILFFCILTYSSDFFHQSGFFCVQSDRGFRVTCSNTVVRLFGCVSLRSLSHGVQPYRWSSPLFPVSMYVLFSLWWPVVLCLFGDLVFSVSMVPVFRGWFWWTCQWMKRWQSTLPPPSWLWSARHWRLKSLEVKTPSITHILHCNLSCNIECRDSKQVFIKTHNFLLFVYIAELQS